MITVEGYSGCEVRIVKNGPTDYVVEKGTNDPTYVPRLLKQRDKQLAAYRANTFPNVVIPRILYTKQLVHEDHTTADDGHPLSSSSSPLLLGGAGVPLLSSSKAPAIAAPPSVQACIIGMPFYHHTDSISFLSTASMDEVKQFSNCLLETLDQNVRLCGRSSSSGSAPTGGDDASAAVVATSSCDVRIFVDKLLDIVKVCEKNRQLQLMEEIAAAGAEGAALPPLSRIRDVIVPTLIRYLESKGSVVEGSGEEDGAKRAIAIPMGACHGDFTLSNVLVLTPHINEPSLNFSLPVVADAGGAASPTAATMTTTTRGLLPPTSPFSTSSSGGFRIALIDFLDSFVESPLADMAKICQDLKYGWTLRLLSTPKKAEPLALARGAGAEGAERVVVASGRDQNGASSAPPPPPLPLKSPAEKAVFAKLQAVDARRAAPASAAAANRRRALLQSTATEIFRDTATISSSGGEATFAEGLQSSAVQVFAAMDHIYQAMLRKYAHYAWFKDYFLVFFIMNQLRVLQYSKDTDAGFYLYRSVEEEFKLFLENEGRGL